MGARSIVQFSASPFDMQSPPQLLIALEGGGTRCQAALLDAAGRLLQTQDSGAVNTHFVPIEQAQAAVLDAVSGVLAAAGIQPGAVDYFVSALVGASFGPETFGALCPRATYRSYGELQVVFARAGIFRPHGVAVVAGTGATAWAVRADDGRQVILGGWGALLGDEGSAYALGLLGLRAAVRAYEQRAPAPTALVEAICAHFNLSQAQFRDGLIALAYHQPLSRTEIADLAVLVTRLAGAHDPLAARITGKVSTDLSNLALEAARRLFGPSESFDVVLAGGLVNAGEIMLGPLHQRLRAEFPCATVQVGGEAPAVALGRLALHDLQEAL
jgi:N-acetylglucosamine kinase-like BadF-type ATPase